MRLLLAEDERGFSDALVAILEHNNYTVDVVYDGEDAYAYGLSDNYDGIGLYPDEGCTVELSEEAQKINVYKLLRAEYQAKDNQLAAAIEYLTK